VAFEEADLRVRELETAVDDLHRQSADAAEVHMLCWPSVVFGDGALMQAVQTNTSWRLGNLKPRTGQLRSPNSSPPDLMSCRMPKPS
jgi:hypothetical protein